MNTKASNRLFWFGIIPALGFQLIGAWLYSVYAGDSQQVRLIYAAVKIFIIMWPLAWIGFGHEIPRFTQKMSLQKSLLWSIGSGLVIMTAVGVAFFLFRDEVIATSGQLADKVSQLGIKESFVLFAIFVTIAHSFIEEYYWRWFIFRGLTLKMSATWSAIISSLFFASHHYIMVAQYFPSWMALLATVGVGLGGLLWSALYYRTKRLSSVWTSHLFADAIVMVIGYYLLNLS